MPYPLTTPPEEEPQKPPVRVLDETKKVHEWRREQLFCAGYPWGSADILGADRELDLHYAIDVLRKAKAKHGSERGLALALECLL